MPKSFLFTNKRFTIYKQLYGNGNNQETEQYEESPQISHGVTHSTSQGDNGLTLQAGTELSSSQPATPRKEYTVPIIKQKERYRNFELDHINAHSVAKSHIFFEERGNIQGNGGETDTTETQPAAESQQEFSVDLSVTPRKFFHPYQLTDYCRADTKPYNIYDANSKTLLSPTKYFFQDQTHYKSPDFKRTPSKHSDLSDGESDSGISLISDDSRHEYSPRGDYHCSEHLSLLFDFFSPRKPVAREQALREQNDVRRVLDFNTPSFKPMAGTNAISPEAPISQDADDIFTCDDCGKRYSTSSNLARHRQTHRSSADKKARQCPHCDKVYVSMPAFSMHVRTHNQGCECPYCGKKFSRPWLLQGHIRTHTGEKPFSCPTCSKSFADKSNLRAHVQTHSTEKPFTCDRCGKAFALKSYLYKHEESSCMRGQRSSHRRHRKGSMEESPRKALSIDEQRRCSW